MDLTSMMEEPQVVDHSWFEEGMIHPGEPTFDPEAEGVKNPNNIKPELAIEWGTAGPNIDIDEPAGVVERNIPEKDLADVSDVILFARDQMNRGRMGSELVAAIKSHYDQDTLAQARDGLREQLALEGIVGCVALDARGYKNCREAVKAAKNSPYKHFIKHIIGCECGDPQMVEANSQMDFGRDVEITGNALDDFFGNDAPHSTEMVGHCRSTMLPILGAQGDLDDSEMDSTMIDLMNVTGVPEDTVKKLDEDRHNNKYSSNLKAIQTVFRGIQARKEQSVVAQYQGTVDASEFMLDAPDNEIEFAAVASSPLDVSLGLSIEQSDVDIPEVRLSNLDGIDKLSSEFGDMELNDAVEAQESLDIDARPGENEVELVRQSSLDIELGQFLEPEFVGSDIFELDAPREALGELDIDMRQDMQI